MIQHAAILFLSVFFVTLSIGAEIHVSPDGDNEDSGSSAAPLKTIQAAVDRAGPGDAILVHGGVYRETVVFPRNGLPEKPISLKKFGSEKVVVSGVEPIENWTLHEGNIWKAPMNWTLGAGRDQLFDGGESLIEARFPNTPAPGLELPVADLSPLWPTFGEFSMPKPKDEPGRIVSELLKDHPVDHWKGAIYQGVHYEGWCMQTGFIESSASGELTVGEHRTKGWWFGPAYGGNYKPEEGGGQIVGHYNALDLPGEWVVRDNAVYLIPRKQGKPEGIEAKRRQLAFDLSGRKHIRIEGIDVFGASARLDGSGNCSFDRCNFRYISHFSHHDHMGQIEHGRDTIRSGETGIYVSGRDNSFTSCEIRYSAGAGFHLRGYHHTIHNCRIDQISYTAHYLNAITDAVSDYVNYENFLVGGHVITFNTMSNGGRHFFNYYGNGTSKASRDRDPMDYRGTLFAHNHLYNGMLLTKDAGFITGYYSSGGTLDGLNSQLAYNVMHDCYDTFAMRIDVLGIVYLDAGTCDVDPHHNLLWAAPGALQRGLWFNTVCVDVNEHDNLFHPMFERNCSQLVAEDFPNGKPFRFGHDFQEAPKAPIWPPIVRRDCSVEAKPGLKNGDVLPLGQVDFDGGWTSGVLKFSSGNRSINSDRADRQPPRHGKTTDPLVFEAIVNDGVREDVKTQWSFVHRFKSGAWLRFADVNLGEGYEEVRLIYGNTNEKPRRMEIRLDREDGPVVATIPLEKTDKKRGPLTQVYGIATDKISTDAKGQHDLYFVFLSDDEEPVCEFEYAQFVRYRGEIPLRQSDTVLELRIGKQDGGKIGEFRPRFTGGDDVSGDFVAKLRPITGTHPLFLVVRCATDAPIGKVEAVSLEKSTPIDWDQLGVPPRRTAEGRMILPEPTNRSCSRPADRYKKSPPRPMLSVKSNAPATVSLDKSFSGKPGFAKPSTATIRSDGEKLSIEIVNPTAKTLDLKRNHVWGSVDGVELTFRKISLPEEKEFPTVKLRGYPDGHAELSAEAPAGIEYTARVEKDAWICRWSIPYASVGQSDPVFLFNIAVRKPSENEWSCFADTERLGFLRMSANSNAKSPLPKENLRIHLDAAATGNVVKDEQGRVSLWKDGSGTKHDAVQSKENQRPVYVGDGIYGKPALEFSEKTRTFFELPDLSDEKIDLTVFAVISNPEANLEVNHDSRIFTTSDGVGEDYMIGTALTTPGMETGGPRIKMLEIGDRWAKAVRIGCFSPRIQTFFKGRIGEILVYDKKLTPDEKDLVRLYLASKWDLDTN